MENNASAGYGRILKSSAIMGGGAVINMLLGLIRTKLAALYLGPQGVGLITNFNTLQTLVSTLFGLGMQTSAVREIAAMREEPSAVAKLRVSLNRVSLLTGLLGAIFMGFFSQPLGRWTFGNEDQTVDVALLGLTLLLVNISNGQKGYIQGLQRIGDLARINVLESLAGTLIAAICYPFYGVRGIILALLSMAVMQLLISAGFSRRIPSAGGEVGWWTSLVAARGLFSLGLVVMITTLVNTTVMYITNVMITHWAGQEALGIYGAANGLSGLFVGFVINSMRTDYYPRLTAMIDRREEFNQLINQQTEVGMLLALPGLLTMFCFSSSIVPALYSHEFIPAVVIMQWMIAGCFGRVIAFPLECVLLARGMAGSYFWLMIVFNVIHLVLNVAGLLTFGVEGVGIAFFVIYAFNITISYWISHVISGFRWSWRALRLVLLSLLMFFVAAMLDADILGLGQSFDHVVVLCIKFGLIGSLSVFCLYELVCRVGGGSRIVGVIRRLSGLNVALSR